jgi:serine/threonine protein kinase/tetratricopeptide (TPR) repeat protein
MPTDDSPLKPPENDQSQQTLDTRTPSPTPGISFVEASSDKPPLPAPRQSAFSPGDTVAKRFRILRFIAHGGMGEVYEALDIELKQKVALKTVRFGLLVDATALERFRQEIVVAKRVTHPNVCRTYDLFRHEATKEGESDVLVVSMELLAGQNLDQFLKEKGKLPTAEALPFVKQMVAGLAAAHEAGVVHRDFKTNNVMLVPPMSGSGPMRAVVSDFGLAHSLDVGEFALTRTGEMLGTPAFMAPEQVTGKEITPATDVYALGVVIFEMVTGRLPFSGKNWRETAFARLEQPPPSPKTLLPELDEQWSRTILKCLEREPANRFQQVQEVVRALAGEADTVLSREVAAQQRRKRLLFASLGLAAVAAIGVAIGVAFPNLFSWRRPPSVTVLGFKNVNGDKAYDPWGDQFRNTLQSKLDIKPVTYMTLASMANPWSPPPPSQMPDEPPSNVMATFHHSGCRFVIYGSYSVEGNPGARKIVWDIHMVDLEKGQSGGSLHKTLLESDRENVAVSAGGELLKILGVSEIQPGGPIPSNQVAELAGTGQRKMENFDYEGARQDFLKALEADPANAVVRSALAEAYWNLGYEEKAKEEAAAALDQAKTLSPDLKIRISLRKQEYSKQWDAAADIYHSLWNTQPENYFYGLELARNQMEGNHLKESLTTLQKLIGKDVPIGIQAQADLRIAEVQARLGKNQERLDAARQAATQAKAAGSQFLFVKAGIRQCEALTDLGLVNQVDSVCLDTVQQSVQLGIATVVANAKTAQANLLVSRGQFADAGKLYEEAREATHAIGDLRSEAGALFNLGYVQYQQNNLPGARDWWEQSLAVSRQRGGVSNDLMRAQGAIANVDGAMGNVQGQITGLREVVKEAESVGDNDQLANALGNLCGTQITSGEVAGAKANCERALQMRKEMQDQSALARSLTDMGDYFFSSDNLQEAKKNYGAALSIQTAIGEKAAILTTRRGLAAVDMELGNTRQAETDLNALLPEFIEAKNADGEANTREILADLYLRLGRLDDAREQINKGTELAAKSQDPTISAGLAIQKARLDIKRKQPASGANALNKVETKMREAHLFELAMEARLARADALPPSARKVELKSFVQEAREHGYLLLARKAVTSGS